MKLSTTQRKFLFKTNASPAGCHAWTSNGHPSAGRDASAWWRTANSLVRLGLLTRGPCSPFVELTPAGADFVASAD